MISTLAVLGGGSAYAPGLIASLVKHASRMNLKEVRLYDIDGRHADLIARLGSKMAAVAGVGFTVAAAPSLEDAVKGADLVLNTMRPGGFPCRRIDETLPVDLGIPGQETIGPGGFFFALRSVPEAHKVADAMVAHAPKAILLNYTNPTNIVTQSLSRRGDVEVIGLCDQADGDLAVLAESLGRGGARATFSSVGLNHASWYADVAIGGISLTVNPRDLPVPTWIDEEHELRFGFSREIAARHPGYWPNSYLAYYTHPQTFVALSRRVGPRTDAITAILPSLYRHFSTEAARDEPNLRRHRGSAGYGDLAVRVLMALGNDNEDPLVLNVVNKGSSTAFDDDTIVEVSVGVSSRGLSRREAPLPPQPQRAFLNRLEAYQLQVVDAIDTATGSAFEQALAANPLVNDTGLARRMIRRARTLYEGRVPLLA